MRSQEFTAAEARKIGDSMSVDWGKCDLEQFRIGLFVELEEGMDDPTTDVSDEEIRSTGQIVLGHLDEQPDYYTEKYHMFAESAKASF
jgi:Protein of unknown function (DUF5661)